jgi:uncharacterized protein (DUF362 family)/NAD-dependent dihydropyrimidine dehydrogenase PreA subunit
LLRKDNAVDTNNSVLISRAGEYDTESLAKLIRTHFDMLGGDELFRGKKVAVKPNLVAAKKPERAATTHPAMLSAVLNVIKEYSPASLIIAESPGGPYSEAALKVIYSSCGITEAAERCEVELNYDTSHRQADFSEGEQCRRFNIITPLAEADTIVNLPKLKSHSLTMLSGAMKNMFGSVPGTEKVEMHARYPDPVNFADMMIDLDLTLMSRSRLITVCDAIVSMEGNGPTGGVPRKTDFILTSLSPFCLDLAAAAAVGFEGRVPMLAHAVRRGLCPEKASNIEYPLLTPEDVKISDFEPPESGSGKLLNNFSDILGGRLVKFLSPHPEIDTSRCVGCGKCRDSCPMGTIRIVETRRGKKARIYRKKCIRCYCCQELCPINSVKTKKNPILKIVH